MEVIIAATVTNYEFKMSTIVIDRKKWILLEFDAENIVDQKKLILNKGCEAK
jgi:hypothetical protein